MSDPAIFRIPLTADKLGVFGLELVDTAAVGYEDSWQAPDGKELPAVTIGDYEAKSTSWVCQVTSGALTPSSNLSTEDRAATFCKVAGQTTVVAEDTFVIDLETFQDAHVKDGLQAYLFANRTKEAYVYFGADSDNAPRMIGRVTLTSAAIGGAAHTDLTATISFPLKRAPDIEFGVAGVGNSTIVKGDGTAPVGP